MSMTMTIIMTMATSMGVFSGTAIAKPGDGSYRNTYYYVVLESLYAGQRKTERVISMDGTLLAMVSPRFKAAMDIEGTGRLEDGRVLNYVGRRDGEIRYAFVRAPFGRGVGSCQLVPFHTVAVDPDRIPLGSVVKIEETVGMVLPDGTKHDGIWRAEDIGGAIREARIDLFVGDGNRGDVLEAHGIRNLMPLTVTVVSGPGEKSCVYEQAEDSPNPKR
jgi:3D (Asp-Asp-Asp) domain-containing protein